MRNYLQSKSKKSAILWSILFLFAFSALPFNGYADGQRKEPKDPRSVEKYELPDVTLLNQDGKKVNLRSFLDSDKPVILDFIFTTCTTICPLHSAGFSSLQTALGKDADKVRLVSITIDPEHDRPEQMKEYLERYKKSDGWDFLTGSPKEIELVMRTFSCKTSMMDHQPLYLIHTPKSDRWVRIEGLVSTADLLAELGKI